MSQKFTVILPAPEIFHELKISLQGGYTILVVLLYIKFSLY